MTLLVVRMTTVSDATSWSITYDCQNDDYNVFIIQVIQFKCARFKQKLNSQTCLENLTTTQAAIKRV